LAVYINGKVERGLWEGSLSGELRVDVVGKGEWE